ncbi:MAG: GNAT family N-acetyltransferase [Gemmatimonadetes bacterium]|nr:GNAT family N-acetyltransferase [Gemmatimonadota bacterium]
MSAFFKPEAPFTEADLEMRILEGPPPEGFECNAEAQNRYLYDRARRDQRKSVSVTHLLFVKGIFAAYITLTADRIMLGPNEKPRGASYHIVPAMKIAQLAVDKSFAGLGLGKFLIGYAIEQATTMRAVIGCRYVTLDAEPHLIQWYEDQGFIQNQEEQVFRENLARERGRPVGDLPASMRFDLREAAA